MDRLLCLLFLSLPLSSAVNFQGPRYKAHNYFIFFEWTVSTADITMAGTDSKIRFDFGWVDATNHLIWVTEGMREIDGNENGRFEEGITNDKFHKLYKEEAYGNLEIKCEKAAASFDEYKSCLSRPNIVFMKLTHGFKYPDLNPKWLLWEITLNTGVNYWGNGEWQGAESSQVKFRNMRGYWTDDYGEYYVRASDGEERHPLTDGHPEIGKVYP